MADVPPGVDQAFHYPHRLDELGQTAIDFGLDFVREHNRRIDELERTQKGPQQMAEHTVKSQPMHFAALVDGTKPFEIRKNDRNYQVADVLHLREWNPDTETYTGRYLTRTITHVTGFAQHVGYVVLGLSPATRVGPLDPDNELVICPHCTSQFRAIPVNVQEQLRDIEHQSQRSYQAGYDAGRMHAEQPRSP